MNNDNKKCPFCGGDGKILYQNLYVECTKCGAFGPSVRIKPMTINDVDIVKAEIWKKWNERQCQQKNK